MNRSFHSFYLSGGMRANAFLPQGFGDPAHRRARVEAASKRAVARSLVEELRAQDARLPPSPARAANLKALAAGGTAVVATGQQVGLFLGPRYTVYKAATAVVIARALSAETGVRCVPLFWLQTEDHDWAEMSGCTLPSGEDAEPLRLSLAPEDDAHPARLSLADRALGPEVSTALAELARALAGSPHADGVVELLAAHYRPGVAPGRAFAAVIAALFADAGLLVYDPRQAAAARLLVPVHRTALRDWERLEAALLERSRALDAAGVRAQIALRAGSPLSFFHRGERGPRYRLVRRAAGDGFLLSGAAIAGGAEAGPHAAGGPYHLEELLAVLEREPLRFSTSALLRPIAQDTLLPTAVYVGGPAEVDYFAQLAPLYAEFGMEPPLVAPRARFKLIPARLRTRLRRLGLAAADLDRPREELIAALSARGGAGALADAPAEDWGAELQSRLETFAARAAAADPGLARAARRTRAGLQRSLGRLARRAQRLALERDRVVGARLAAVERWLRPGGAPQERAFGFPAFAARAGAHALIEAVLAAVDPFDPRKREIDLP